ncbi:UPF0014-domain-containing protein [Lactifluus subvellereus]|nr:UPF0014-domain-containing protein [Lactifluus subvellereus]
MDSSPPSSNSNLGWSHVGIGLAFITMNIALSQALQLRIGASLTIAALRCVVQLTFVATVLQRVFAAQNMWAVGGIALLLNTLGTFETVVIKAERRCRHMFPAVLAAMLVSTIPTSILGARFAMGIVPFWRPEQYIPVVGMLCGNAISGVSVTLGYVLRELDENRDKTETLLAFGASRFEACRPLVVNALRLALMPTINAMSVMGIIAIPGMMTGAILGGADVQQAARLQMIIMFMIAASSALSSIIATFFALSVCIDSEHRIRGDRIESPPHALYRASSDALQAIVGALRSTWSRLVGKAQQHQVRKDSNTRGTDSERAPLLG